MIVPTHEVALGCVPAPSSVPCPPLIAACTFLLLFLPGGEKGGALNLGAFLESIPSCSRAGLEPAAFTISPLS